MISRDLNSVKLVVPTRQDVATILEWQNDHLGLAMLDWENFYGEEALIKWLDCAGSQRVLMITVGDFKVGFASNSTDASDRSSSVSMYLIPEARCKGIGQVVMLKYLTILFEVDSLHRVSFSVFDYNKPSLNNFKRLGFSPEGVNRESKWYQGRYWDVHRFSVLDREWPELKKRLTDRVQNVNDRFSRRPVAPYQLFSCRY